MHKPVISARDENVLGYAERLLIGLKVAIATDFISFPGGLVVSYRGLSVCTRRMPCHACELPDARHCDLQL